MSGVDQRIIDLIEASGARAVSVVYGGVGTATPKPPPPPRTNIASHDEGASRGDSQSVARDNLVFDTDRVYHAASLMKIAVMMEVFHQAHTGQLGLDERIPVKNSFASLVGEGRFSVAPEDDSDHALHDGRGEASTSDLVRRMIVRSGNLATNLLVERVGQANIQRLMDELGAPDIVVRRGVEDQAAFDAGINNTVTARGLAHLLTRLARREVVSASASDAMIDILLGQEFCEGIPAGLPPGTPVAHKTGWNAVAYHDAAIIDPYGPSPRILVVLTTGLGEMALAGEFVARLTRAMVAG